MRMIDKLPKTPNLNEKLVRMISGLLFLKNIGIGRPEYYGYDPKILFAVRSIYENVFTRIFQGI